MRNTQTNPARRGAVAPLAALLLAFLVGMLAFALDVGYMAVVKGELQNAADAAALAGAARVQVPYVQYYLPSQLNQLAIFNGVSDTSDPNSAVSVSPSA